MSKHREAIDEALAAVELAEEALKTAKSECFHCNSPAFGDVNAAMTHLKNVRLFTEQAKGNA